MPLRSALAARLLIERLASINFPVPLSAQATWWATYYNTLQSAAYFQRRVSIYEKTTGTTSPLAFVDLLRQAIAENKSNI